jgi:5'(3')-deoxyribonucleotidase
MAHITNHPNTIYVDMDGVLCNFNGQSIKFFGEKFDTDRFFTLKEKAASIQKDRTFWSDMAWMPGGRALWDYVRPFGPHILSAIAEWNSWGSIEQGKREWIAKHLRGINNNAINLCRRRDKQVFAHSRGVPNILIDDNKKNIAEWTGRGGIGHFYTTTPLAIQFLRDTGFIHYK